MRKILQLLISVLIGAIVWPVMASPITGLGENILALGVHASKQGERLLILAGRRAPNKDFGPFVEIGIIDLRTSSGTASFAKVPGLDGDEVGDFQSTFSSDGEFYFAKTAGTDAIQVGKMRHDQFVAAQIQLPPSMSSGGIRVQHLTALEGGGLDIGINSNGDGVLITLNPDLTVKSMLPIRQSTEFQAVLRLSGADRFLVASAIGEPNVSGNITNYLALRGADLAPSATGTATVRGFPSTPLVSPDGSRIALSTSSVFPGRVVVHLFEPSLAKIASLVIIEKPSYPNLVSFLLSNSKLVALHAEDGQCFATLANSRDGRLIERRKLTDLSELRCVDVSGAIAGSRLALVLTTMSVKSTDVSTSVATQFMRLDAPE